MANPGNAAIAKANDNTTAGTSSLRNFITTPFEEPRAQNRFRSSRSFPLSRKTFSTLAQLAGDAIPLRPVKFPFKRLVAQLESERDR
jgi:hypothetical protein